MTADFAEFSAANAEYALRRKSPAIECGCRLAKDARLKSCACGWTRAFRGLDRPMANR